MRFTASLTAILLLAGVAPAVPPDPQRLADRIDHHLEARLATAKVSPAPLSEDAEFLRRAYLDLTGRIPAPRDVYDFLSDASPGKRAKLVDSLLETPRHASHSATLWRAILTPEMTSLPEARVFQVGFEAWLQQQFRSNTPYDRWVRELLTTPLSPDGENPTAVLRKPQDPNPLAFFAVKEARPENLAASVTRVFLGVQMECAQCHNHPFARWTRDQFWNQAAFFAGLERSGDGLFAPVSERLEAGPIRTGEGEKRVSALFLVGPGSPPSGGPLRPALADWIVREENPFFARAAVNRIWGQMFGRGLVDPVDDFHDDNPPSHPELLDELAKAFTDSGYDLRFVMKAMGRTRAYQRSSARTDAGQDDPRLYARMAVKGLTGEQLFDTLVQATGYREPVGRGSPREAFLTRFALTKKLADPETSIPQALALMNGRFVADATKLESSPTLRAACELPGLSLTERIEVLTLSSLGRKPTPREQERLVAYVELGGSGRWNERLADLFWTLLNSAEFRLNH